MLGAPWATATSASFSRRKGSSKSRALPRMWFEALILAGSVVAGAIAALAGFGIGSLLTPILALQVDTRLAVAAVSVPHAIGTAVRLWFVAGAVDRRVFWQFGLTSAAGGLTGALLYGWASNRWLAMVFGCLLLFAAASQ